jgi:hypothetical protein
MKMGSPRHSTLGFLSRDFTRSFIFDLRGRNYDLYFNLYMGRYRMQPEIRQPNAEPNAMCHKYRHTYCRAKTPQPLRILIAESHS